MAKRKNATTSPPMNKPAVVPARAPAAAPALAAAARTPATPSIGNPAPAFRTSAPSPSRPTRDQIAKRAYEIWEAKGRPIGQDQVNWQQAERELLRGIKS